MTVDRFRLFVTPRDRARDRYVDIPVQVPAGTTRIAVTLDYLRSPGAIIDLGLCDADPGAFPGVQGFRGWSGSARDSISVATDEATPGYLPGSIRPGVWRIVLGLVEIPAEGLWINLMVAMDDAARSLAAPAVRAVPAAATPGWFRGDLHCHTFHSDAAGAPEILHAAARREGLRFLAVTDHNTISQRRYFDPRSTVDLVFVRGTEITCALGHANVFGIDGWVDFRMRDSADAAVLHRHVRAQGGLLSVNHDKPPNPWTPGDSGMDCQEVWHSHWLTGNEVALDRYDERLRRGRRITLVGGSDFHQPALPVLDGPFQLGRPTTVLWLDTLSEAGILDALRNGRCYVTEDPRGPHLSFVANGAPMGAATSVAGPIHVAATVTGAKGDLLAWVDGRGLLREDTIPDDDWRPELSFDGVESFLRAEIVARASRDRLMAALAESRRGREILADCAGRIGLRLRRALSNPVYVTPIV